MKKKILTLDEIQNCLGDEFLNIYGETKKVSIDNLADSNHVNEKTLDWINIGREKKQYLAENSKAKVILSDNTVEYSENMRRGNKVLIHVRNPRNAMIRVAYMFLEKKEPMIHPTAVVDTDAVIDPSAHIGAGCVVGKARIGAETVLMPNVVIYDDVVIGDRCLLQSGVIIGTDGLGCSRDKDGKLTKFPHLGGVIIGSDVEIGANSQVARGALSDTIIKDGCKMNGLCFIAHNCVLEENVWITGDTMLCGSVQVGRNTTIFSNVVVRDQCSIGENSRIGMGAVVVKDVPSGETWIGNPARKLEKR